MKRLTINSIGLCGNIARYVTKAHVTQDEKRVKNVSCSQSLQLVKYHVILVHHMMRKDKMMYANLENNIIFSVIIPAKDEEEYIDKYPLMSLDENLSSSAFKLIVSLSALEITVSLDVKLFMIGTFEAS